MLTRFVRIQLIIFTIASVVALVAMVFNYMQVPTLLGLGRISVTLELPASGGLYRFSNVTYRGVQVGTVTAVDVLPTGAKATLSLSNSQKIPADLHAEVHSVSAVGEQYVDLLPRTDSPPYLSDGSTIAASNTTVPQEVGPMLDKVSALVDTIPKDKLSDLLDESYKGFNGAGYDFGSLLDSSAILAKDVNGVSDQTRTLIDDAGPLLDGQAETADAIRVWAHSLAGVTRQVATNDAQVRTLLDKGPGFANETARLLDQIKPTLPVLLANMTTIGQIGVTYNPSLRQLLVLLPPYVAATQTYGMIRNNGENLPQGDFSLSLGDPPACTVGFLPPSSWRSPADTSVIDTPDGLYCKLPQDSPIAVRGARNLPCMGHPGKRAPTVEICDSDKPFEPLAQHEHVLGPYPFDPNLISQGMPPDDRVNPDSNIYGPTEGTPMPPGSDAPSAPPPPAVADIAPPPATEAPPPAGANGGGGTATPSSFSGNGSAAAPSVAVAEYNPRNGAYSTSNGQLFQQSDLADLGQRTWKEMLIH